MQHGVFPEGTELRCWKSTVRRGVPSSLMTITIWLHQVTGVPIGTGAIMPLVMSQSRPALTAAVR